MANGNLPAPVIYQRAAGNSGNGGRRPPNDPVDAEFKEVGDDEDEPHHVEEDESTLLFLQIIGFGLALLLIAAGIWYWNEILYQINRPGGAVLYQFKAGPLLVAAGVGYIVYSYFVNGQVAETEMGGAFSFGHPLVNLESGPNLMPFGLVQIVRLPRGVQKIQVPSDDPEKIYHGPDNTEPPRAGMVRTLRVLTGSPQGGIENLTGGDPLHARMMLEAMYVVRFQVDGALDFIVNYVDLEHLREHIRDVGDPTLAVLFSQLTPAGITEKLRELNGDFDTTIGTAFVHGGARFIDARVTVDPGHTVAESLAKVPGARAEAQAAILIGEGQGGADKARFTGRGAGLKQMAKDLDVDGAAVLGAETARDMAGTINKNADTIVLGGGAMGDFIAAAKVAAGAFQPKPKPADKPEDKENKDAKDS